MDRIKLQRRVQGELPRYYSMTGGTFKEMLAAVKALDFRKFQSDKSWLIRKRGLDALARRFQVMQEPFIRAREFVEESIQDDGSQVYATGYFEIRDEHGWQPLPFHQRVEVAVTDEEVAAECERITAEAAKILGKPVDPYPRYYGVRALARRAVEEAAGLVIARFNEVMAGRATLDALREAGLAVKEMLE